MKVILRAALAATCMLGTGAVAVVADDGVPTSSPVPIPLSQLRPTEIHGGPVPLEAPVLASFPPLVPSRQKELVVFVGGYASIPGDGAFDALKALFPPDRYDVRRHGDDPRFPYDTYGSIDRSAGVLTREIREVGPGYAAVNVVSHSMGGVVVDRAFASGLSASDGVRTHVSIAGPHSGADFARVPTTVLPLIAPVKEIVRAVAVVAARDPESDAARDLATARPVPPPRGVARVDISLATDGFVNRFDARDPGVELRLFLPSSPGELADGHGGSLTNRQVAEVVLETVRSHRVPPDRRDPFTRVVAAIVWDREAWLWRTVLVLMTLGAFSLYAARFLPFCREAADRVNAVCARFLRAVGR